MRNQWQKISFKVLGLVLILALVAACGQNGGSKGSEENNTGGNDLKGKKIALIIEGNLGTFSQQYIAGVEDQVKKFGGTVTVFTADFDKAKMASNLDAAVNQRFDGILIDHGDAESLGQGVNRALEQNIPVVAFDAILDVEGVTNLQQGDQLMAELTLEALANDIGGKGNIVKIWVAGFAPMERRQIAYEAFLNKYTDIKEVATFGNATASTALDTQAQMEAILKQFPKGEIDAVWASWDEFAKGAARAIAEAGRDEIKVYGIDISDEDLEMLQNPDNPWIATAAVDPGNIGRVQVRFLYQKLSGIETPANVILDPVYVSSDKLPAEPVTTEELGSHLDGWGNTELGYTEELKKLEQ